MKDLRKKIFRSVIAGLMIFSIVLPSNVFASNPSSTDANDFPKTETLTYNGKITYDGSTVGDFTIGGKQAFCLEHPKTTPGNNTKLTTDIYNNSNIKNGKDLSSGLDSKTIKIMGLSQHHFFYLIIIMVMKLEVSQKIFTTT